MDSNCPNCGAPITGVKCEYCGTVFHNTEYQQLLEKKAVLEFQAAQMRMNAYLIQSIPPCYQNRFYPL